MAGKKTPTDQAVFVEQLKRGRVKLKIIGDTPLYFNAMSAKAKRTLLVGGGKKTAAEKKKLKHDPEAEFRDSVYTTDTGPTLLSFPSPAFKRAMAEAAIETPGITKKSVERLVFLPAYGVPVWGRPVLKMDVVRSADIAKTPDVRTRAFLPRWAIELDVAFVTPTLSVHAIVSLLSNAGMIVGIGDFRQEKGRGSFGTFSVAGDDLGDMQGLWDELMGEGRDVQQLAMDNPEPADAETRSLMEFLNEQRAQRGL